MATVLNIETAKPDGIPAGIWIPKQPLIRKGLSVKYVDEMVLPSELGGRIEGIINYVRKRAGEIRNVPSVKPDYMSDEKILLALKDELTDEERRAIAVLKEEADWMYDVLQPTFWLNGMGTKRAAYFYKTSKQSAERMLENGGGVTGLLEFTDREFLRKRIVELYQDKARTDEINKIRASGKTPYNYQGPIYPADDSKDFIVYQQKNKSGKAAYCLRNKQGVSQTGKVYYDEIKRAMPYTGGWLLRKDGMWGLMNLRGVLVLPVEYEEIEPAFLPNGHRLRQNGKWGFTDDFGNKILDCEYDSFTICEQKARQGWEGFVVCKDGKYGYCDKSGHVVVPAEYDSLSLCNDDVRIIVVKDGKEKALRFDGKDVL